VLLTLAVAAGLIGLYAWSPWVRPTESDWLGTYEAWSDGIETSLSSDRTVSRAMCESTYDEGVGDPPTERFRPVSDAARRGCGLLTEGGWQDAQGDAVRALMAAHGGLLPPRLRRDLSEITGSSVGVRPKVYCWQPQAWAAFFPHYALVRGGEVVSLKSIADTERNRIDLDPAVCTILTRYLQRIRPSPLSYENYELAEALAVLTHQAERLKHPDASEVELECYAVQHVRPRVEAAGWGADFAEEIALHAWEISYAQLPPHFRTPECRNGRSLDRNPRSSAWP
jgi:hypothetical protein